jgi:glutathione S-transferase
MALLMSGLAVELREISLKAKPAAMLAVSPKATVPVLILPDAQVIDESLDIMRWALDQSDPGGWLAPDADDMIGVNDGPFKHHLDRAKYPGRYSGGEDVDHYRAAVALLLPLEGRLAASPSFSIIDAALLPFVRQFAAIDEMRFAAEPIPHIQRWLANWQASEMFGAIMVKVPLWSDGDKPHFFP